MAEPTKPGTTEKGQTTVAGATVGPNAGSVSAAATNVPRSYAAQKSPGSQLVFGGAFAALLGFGAAWVWLDRPVVDGAQSALSARIDALDSQIAALPEPAAMPDLAPLTDGQATLSGQIDALGARNDAADSAVAALDTRLTVVERAPAPDGSVTDTAIASLERELAGLHAELDAQNARIDEITSGAVTALAANEADAAAVQAAAAAAARVTAARAALAQIRAAIDTGAPFDAPLAELADAGFAAPDALTAVAENGAPSLAALQTGFPDAARAALAAARTDDDATGGILSFLDSQTQSRSVAPRDGDDVDAVQSRAEAALRAGQIDAALAEIDALPEGPAAAFADWRTGAEQRQAALGAADAVSADIDSTQNP